MPTHLSQLCFFFAALLLFLCLSTLLQQLCTRHLLTCRKLPRSFCCLTIPAFFSVLFCSCLLRFFLFLLFLFLFSFPFQLSLLSFPQLHPCLVALLAFASASPSCFFFCPFSLSQLIHIISHLSRAKPPSTSGQREPAKYFPSAAQHPQLPAVLLSSPRRFAHLSSFQPHSINTTNTHIDRPVPSPHTTLLVGVLAFWG